MKRHRFPRQEDRGIPLVVVLAILAAGWTLLRFPWIIPYGSAPALRLVAFAALAGALALAARLSSRAVYRPDVPRPDHKAPSDHTAPPHPQPPFQSDTDGLRELLPAPEYERLLADLLERPGDGYGPPDSGALTDAEQRLRCAFSETALGMVILDGQWNIRSANQGQADMTGYTQEELTGKSVLSLADEAHREEIAGGLRRVSDGEIASYRSERRLIRKDGSPVQLRCCVSRLQAAANSHILVLSEDITAEVRHREKLTWQVAHDTLTGLPNRAQFEKALEHTIQHVDLDSPEVALLYLDIDSFKLINDTMGHSAGDLLLVQVAERLRGSLEESDFLARIGGDEFAVIVRCSDGPEHVSLRAERILATFGARFRVRDSEVTISASMGISRYPLDGLDADGLLQGADAAMYDAKHSGHNRYCFFTAQLKDDACERLLLANRLGKALEDHEMYVDFQPQYELSRNRLVGFEALCRWRSATLGEVTPSRFIPAAEESGLIVPIGQFVLREACQRAVTWQTGLAPVQVAVNVSAVQFGRPDFVESVLAIVRETGIDPRLLELELTETSLVRDRDDSARKMGELRTFGIRIAIDDFGTGYSSLSYLQHMPVDALKVDRSFTSRLSTSSTAVTMVRAIIAMARALGLRVVTEGVETEPQAEILRQLGSDEVQGYLYGRPESPKAASDRIWHELVPAAILTGLAGDLALLSDAIGGNPPEISARRTVHQGAAQGAPDTGTVN